eukprot:3649295-Amphidinium_carterae.1
MVYRLQETPQRERDPDPKLHRRIFVMKQGATWSEGATSSELPQSYKKAFTLKQDTQEIPSAGAGVGSKTNSSANPCPLLTPSAQ